MPDFFLMRTIYHDLVNGMIIKVTGTAFSLYNYYLTFYLNNTILVKYFINKFAILITIIVTFFTL